MLKVNILKYLKKNIETERLKHAYLFEGAENSDRKEIVQWFIKNLQCEQTDTNPCNTCRSCQDIEKNQHPDVLVTSTKVEIKEVRNLRQHLTLSPFNGNYKIAVIDSADKISLDAISTLLKTLEEPQGRVLLILTTSRFSALPRTILSRCEKISITPAPLTKIANDLTNQEYNDLLQKPLIDIFKYLEKTAKDKFLAISLLDSWLFLSREKKDVKTIKEIRRVKNLILNTNINQRLALENLALNFFYV